MATSISGSLLPDRCLIDTGVLIRWLGDHSGEPKSAYARAFVDAMLNANREILIAAPTIGEAIRHQPGRKIPNVRNVVVVAFDDRAAEVLGNEFHREVLIRFQTPNAPLDYIKYDAMIVACAVRHKAKSIVTFDHGMMNLAKALSPPMTCNTPADFIDRRAALTQPQRTEAYLVGWTLHPTAAIAVDGTPYYYRDQTVLSEAQLASGKTS